MNRAPLHLADIYQCLKPLGNCERIASLGGSVPPSSGPSGENNFGAEHADRSEAPSGDLSSSSHKGGGKTSFEEAGSSERTDVLRRDALEALHSYIVAASGYELPRSMVVFKRVVTTLDNQLRAQARTGRAGL